MRGRPSALPIKLRTDYLLPAWRISAMVIDSDTRRAEAVVRTLGVWRALDEGDLRRFDTEVRRQRRGRAPGSSCTTPPASSW